MLRHLLTNLQEVILGTKLTVLFPAIPLAIAAECYGFGRVSIHFPIYQFLIGFDYPNHFSNMEMMID